MMLGSCLTRQAYWEPELPAEARTQPAAPRFLSTTQPLPHISGVYVPYAPPTPATYLPDGLSAPPGWAPFEVHDPWGARCRAIAVPYIGTIYIV